LVIANYVGVANWIQLTTYAHQVPLKTTRTVAMACCSRKGGQCTSMFSIVEAFKLGTPEASLYLSQAIILKRMIDQA